MSDYVLKLRQLYEEADIHALRNEELLLFKYLCGCTNHELRKELLKIKEPSVKKVQDLILTWEISKRADKEVAKTAKAASVQPHKGGRKTTPKGKMPSQTPEYQACLLYTSPSPRDKRQSRMPSSA